MWKVEVDVTELRRCVKVEVDVTELRRCVKVEVDVLGPNSPYGLCGRKATFDEEASHN